MTTPFFSEQVFESDVEFTVQDSKSDERKGTINVGGAGLFGWTKAAAVAAMLACSTLTADARAQATFDVSANFAVKVGSENVVGHGSWRDRAQLFDNGTYQADPHTIDDEPMPDYGF